VVVMGTGEPLDNYDALVRMIEILTHAPGLDISQRNVTVSTCGLVPKIYELADLKLQITLAISLHAVNDEKRRELMPIANTYSIEEILKACRYYYSQNNRRITFEYSLVKGVNDSREDAKALAALLEGMNCHINLIPVNPIEERDYRQTEADAVLKFKNMLEKYGRNVTIRREMGRDIQAACGQLRKKYMEQSVKREDNMRAYAGTDIGCVRTMNQDGYFCSMTPIGPFPNLFIVADGMGGHQAGDYASRYAIETFLAYISHTETTNLIRVMDEGIAMANQKVLEKSFENEELAGMGTTMVVAFSEDRQLYVANVGDSRLYLIGHEINQVTEDHSYVAAMMRAGELTKEQARNHPEKNVITRAVGVSQDVKADFFEVDLKPGDKVLMCSDGLSNMIEDDRLFDVINANNVEDSVKILIDEAKKNGGYDNITAIVIEPQIEEVNEC